MSEMVIDEIVEYLRTLPDHLQEEVLLFTKQLSPSLRPVGVSGSVLVKFAGLIPADELDKMSEAIELDCGRIDIDEW